MEGAVTVEKLRRAIESYGVGIGQDIVKVDMFLNHRIDTGLLFEIGRSLAEEFRAEKPELILTVESSGIAVAVAAAHELGDLPVIFAKKGRAVTNNGEMLEAPVYSFTHKTQNIIRIDRKYLPKGSRVLIIDDFLADGEAVRGLINICGQQEAVVVGVGIAIEKGFQQGGKKLRDAGVHLKSLAIIDGIENGRIILREEN